MEMQILVENSSISDDFGAEHGLSIYIETKLHKILFDTGQTSLFLENAKKMGINLDKVDTLILSHAHYDHTGGVGEFLQINKIAKIYASKHLLTPCYNGEKYIGFNPEYFDKDRFILTDDLLEIDDELTLISGNNSPLPNKIESFGLSSEICGKKMPDQFLHEQYLVVKNGGGNVLFSGCAHKGILNILHLTQDYNIKYAVGGLHLSKITLDKTGENILSQLGNNLDKSGITFLSGHCTGEPQFDFLKNILQDKLQNIPAGAKISF